MSHTSADIAKTLDIDDCGCGDEALASPQDPMVGTTLQNRYRIEDVLGEGGSSVIYRGVHTTIGRTVAIKMLRPELVRNGETVARFLREGRAACRVRHEHVVEATDFGVTPDGDVFLVMEYLEGEDLASLIEREGLLPWPRARAIALQICEAIDAAHAAGVIHRDISLQNCFRVLRERNPDYVKVIDFGIAKMLESSAAEADEVGVTGNAEIFGTPEYMAPEQVRRTVDADARTDVYALGVVLYALVTGRLPLRGATALDTLVRQIYEDVVPPSQLVGDIPVQLDAAILRALEKDPEARFQSMAELADALENVPAMDLLDAPAANEMPVRKPAFDPMTDLELASLSDHDLRSEAPAERLLGPSAKLSIGMRWPMAAAAACALLFAGATALDRKQSAPTETAPTVQTSALVSPPLPSVAAPVRTATAAPIAANPAAAELATTLPSTMPDRAMAVAVASPPPPKATKSWRRAGRQAVEPTPTPDLAGAGLPSPELVAPSHAAVPSDVATDDALDEDEGEVVEFPRTQPSEQVPAPGEGASVPDATPAAPVQRPSTADPFATDPAEEIKDPFGSL
jgi:serine/threonine-protein kinase